MDFFRYNIVVAAYHVFVYVVSRAGRQVSPLASLMMISDMISKHVGAVKVF